MWFFFEVDPLGAQNNVMDVASTMGIDVIVAVAQEVFNVHPGMFVY